MDTPNTLDTMLKDIEGMNAAVDYFTTNINRVPPMLHLKFIEETLAYAERIKPLYKEKRDNVYRNLVIATDTVCVDVLYDSAGDFGIGGLHCLVD